MKHVCSICGVPMKVDAFEKQLYQVFGEPDLFCMKCAVSDKRLGTEPELNAPNLKVRSVEQNRYYWGIIIRFIMKFRGWSEKQAHAWVKCTWNIETTQNLSTIKFEEIMASLRQLVFKFWGLNIPQPNDDLEYLGGRFEWEKLYYLYNPVAKPDPS